MKNILILFSTVCVLFLSSNFGFAQSLHIKGKVTVFDSIAVINAEVLVKSTDSIYKTDEYGMFQIVCSNKDKIVVSANGFKNESQKITESSEDIHVNLTLKNNPESREIAFGYGHVKERDKLFASSSMDDEYNDFWTYNNMLELIEGRFPGVDTYGGTIVIRGVSSPDGDNNPLIIVDGVKVDYDFFNRIAPTDVKSIDVIKDGSTAMYGAEGGNGVIVVETKKRVQ